MSLSNDSLKRINSIHREISFFFIICSKHWYTELQSKPAIISSFRVNLSYELVNHDSFNLIQWNIQKESNLPSIVTSSLQGSWFDPDLVMFLHCSCAHPLDSLISSGTPSRVYSWDSFYCGWINEKKKRFRSVMRVVMRMMIGFALH